MIELTRLNQRRILVNCDLIKFAEAAPDTTLALVTGEKLVVLESCDQVIERILAYRALVLSTAWPEASAALNAKNAHTAMHAALPDTGEDA